MLPSSLPCARAMPPQARAQRLSMSSKANGALMRISPVAVWGHPLDPATLAQHAAADARLSHPNPTCCDCSAAYAIAAAHLIRHPGDAEGAMQAACTWAEQHAGGCPSRGEGGRVARGRVACCTGRECWGAPGGWRRRPHQRTVLAGGCACLPGSPCRPCLAAPLARGASCHLTGEEARQWLFHDSLLPLEQLNCHEMSGFVRHGFTLAFLHLRLRTPFTDAIQ